MSTELDDLMADPEPEEAGPPFWDCATCWTQTPSDLEECLGCGRWRYKTVDTLAGAEAEIDPVPPMVRYGFLAAKIGAGVFAFGAIMYSVNYVVNMFTWTESEAVIVDHTWRQETVIVDKRGREIDRVTEEGGGLAPVFPRAAIQENQQRWCQANYAMVLESEVGGRTYQDQVAPLKPMTDLPQPCLLTETLKAEFYAEATRGTKIPVQVNGNGAIVPDLFKMMGISD